MAGSTEANSGSLIVDPALENGWVVTPWGERSRARLRPNQTHGAMSIMDYAAPAGFGPGRHLHQRDDETLLLLQGTIAIWTPGYCRTAGPGDVVMLPRLKPHTWRSYGDEPVRMTAVTAPGDLDRFFELIVERGLAEPNEPGMKAVAFETGCEFIGPPLTADEAATILRGEMVL